MSKPVNKDSRDKTLKLLDEPDPDDSIQREFLLFHSANPHVYKFLVHYAHEAQRQLKQRGIENPQYSIAAVVERVRWHVNFEVKGYKDFKVDNDFRARYSRLIQRTVPKLRGFFNIRKLRAENNHLSSKEIAKHVAGKERITDDQGQH